MKKLLFTTAIVSLLFVGCNGDNNNDDPNDPSTERVRLLPSRIITEPEWGGRPDTLILEYNAQNQLVRIGRTIIRYDANSNLASIDNVEFRHAGNRVFVDGHRSDNVDTLVIGTNGRLERLMSHWRDTRTFTYNSDGRLTGIVRMSDWSDDNDTTDLIYDHNSPKSIWRHVNMPDWFWAYATADEHAGGSMISWPWRGSSDWDQVSMGIINMPSKIGRGTEITNRFDYLLDADSYVRQIDVTTWGSRAGTITIEWMPVR